MGLSRHKHGPSLPWPACLRPTPASAEWQAGGAKPRQMQRVLLQVSRSSLRRAFRSWALLTSREAAPPQASCAVTLVGTELMSSMWTGDYTVYLLEGDVNTGVERGVSGVFRLQKRYSEFYALHKQLASMLERETMLALALKNMMPPPVPDKNSQRVVAQRRSALLRRSPILA